MTVRELRNKLDRVPEEYLDLEVLVYDTQDGVFQEEDIVAGVNIWRHRGYLGTFLGIGESYTDRLERVWPDPDKEEQ